ncbi:MAG: DUF669 domain-containing protein [Clostridiales bacterium]|nr:DUF669 domain-containing protein [Clostridiales bacterium]
MITTNYAEVNDLIPEGIYETVITAVKEDGKITLSFEIRRDIEQECKGRTFTHWMNKVREPSQLDAAIGGYSYNAVMRIAKSAQLPEGKNYATLNELLTDLVGRAVRVELYHDTFDGRKYLKIKYWYESEAPALTYKPSAPVQRKAVNTVQQQSYMPQQYAPATPQTAENSKALPW